MAVFGESRSNQTARHPGLEPLLLSSRAVKVSAASCRSEPRIASSLLSREFISGRANGRFIQAEATGWPEDLQISATSCNSLFSSAAEPSYFQQKLAQWPFYQWLALIARKRPMAVSSKQKQPDGQTSRFQPQVATLLVSRTINVSAAGPSYLQQKPAQWPFYQGLALVARKRQIAVSSRQKQADGQTSRFQKQIAISLLSRATIYQRPGQAIFKQKPAQWPF